MPEKVDSGLHAGKDLKESQTQVYLSVIDDKAREDYELRQKKIDEEKRLAKFRRQKYLGYLMQVQEAIKQQDLQKIRNIQDSILTDRDFDIEYRIHLQESIRDRVVSASIISLRERGDLYGLVRYEKFIAKLDIQDDEKEDFLHMIRNCVDYLLSHLDYKQIREFQNKIFFDNTLDNIDREELFRLTELHIKNKRLERKESEKAHKALGQQKREAAEFYKAEAQLTDLPLVDNLGNYLEQGPTFPLDVEGVVQRFRLYDFDKLQQFRERVNNGEYPLYKEQLLHIIRAFQQEFSNEFSEERERSKVREKWHRVFQKTVRKYRTERRKPGANIHNVDVKARMEFSTMSREIAKDTVMSAEDKEHLFGKIRAYLEKHPLESQPFQSNEMTNFPPVLDSQSLVLKLLRQNRMRLNS